MPVIAMRGCFNSMRIRLRLPVHWASYGEGRRSALGAKASWSL